MSLGSLVVDLEINNQGFRVKLNNADALMRRFGQTVDRTAAHMNRMERSTGGFLARLRDIAIVGHVVQSIIQQISAVMLSWQRQILSTAGEIERLTKLMEGMSTAADDLKRSAEATSNVDFIFKMAREAPFQVRQLADSFVKLKSMGIDPTNGSLQSLVDAVARFGGDSNILHRASIAIQQMAGKGVISMEELRQQLGEAIPNAIRLMAQAMGMSIGDLIAEISKGRVEAKSALERLFNEFEMQMGGSAKRMMETWSGLTQRMITEWDLFKNAVANTEVTIEGGKTTTYLREMKGLVQDVIDLLSSKQGQYFAQQIGQMVTQAAVHLRNLMQWIIANISQLRRFGEILLSGIKWYIAYKGVEILVAGFTSLVAVGRNVLTLFAAFRAAITATMGVMTGASGAATAMRVAVASIGSATAALAGPIGIGIAAIAVLVTWINKSATAAKEAADEIINSYGAAASRASLEQVEKGIAEIKRRIDKEERAMQARTKRWGVGFGDVSKENERSQRTITRLNQELERQERARTLAVTTLRQREVQQFVDFKMKEVDAAQQANRTMYQNAVGALFDELNAKRVTEEGYFQSKYALAEHFYEKNKQLLEKEVATVKWAIERKKEKGEDTLLQEAYLAGLQDRLAQIRDTWEATRGSINRGELLDPKKTGTDKIPKHIQLLNSLKQKAEALREALAERGSTGFIARTIEKLAQLEKVGKVPEEVAKEIRALAVQIERDTGLSKIADGIVDVDAQIARLQERLNDTKQGASQSMLARLMGGEFGNIEFLRKTKEGAAALEEFMAKIAQLGEIEAKVNIKVETERAQKKLIDLQRETRTATISLTEDQHARQIALLESELQARVEKALKEIKLEEDKTRYFAELADWYQARMAQVNRDNAGPVYEMLVRWQNVTDRMRDATAGWLDDLSNKLTKFVTTGKFEFQDFVSTVIDGLIKIMIQENMVKILGGATGGAGIFDAIIGAFTKGATGGAGASVQAAAMGGVMTSRGMQRLKRYATGGVATRPQLALFGEGATPEAFVPLPDGRSIPVTMRMQTPQAAAPQMSVAVNVINKSGVPVDAQQGTPRFDGKKMILDVVLEAAGRPGQFRDAIRGAVR